MLKNNPGNRFLHREKSNTFDDIKIKKRGGQKPGIKTKKVGQQKGAVKAT